MAKNCSEKCKDSERGQKACCFTDCAMEAFGVLTDGKFDAEKAKKEIARLVAEDPSWTPEVKF